MTEPRLCWRYGYRTLDMLAEPFRLACPIVEQLRVVEEIEVLVPCQNLPNVVGMVIEY